MFEYDWNTVKILLQRKVSSGEFCGICKLKRIINDA